MKKPEERFYAMARIQEITKDLVRVIVEKAKYRTEAVAALRGALEIVETFPDTGETRLSE